MEYLKICEVAEKWGISQRRLQILCANGKIEGAKRFGRAWMIPDSAKKPLDGRTKASRGLGDTDAEVDVSLPRNTPFLHMTNLYNEPGCANNVFRELAYYPEAQILFSAEVAYLRGEIDKVYDIATYLLHKHSGYYVVLSAGMLLAQCAIWQGDLELWRRAKLQIYEANAKNEIERDGVTLAVCAIDSMLYDVKNFPDWFKIGCFEV